MTCHIGFDIVLPQKKEKKRKKKKRDEKLNNLQNIWGFNNKLVQQIH
jgi:hypothetical protein